MLQVNANEIGNFASKEQQKSRPGEPPTKNEFVRIGKATIRSPKVSLKIDNLQANAIVDTGATISLIKESFAKELNRNFLEDFTNIRDLNDNSIGVLGKLIVTVELGVTCVTNTKLIVVPDTSCFSAPLLIGTDFLNRINARVDLKLNALDFSYKKSGSIKIFDEDLIKSSVNAIKSVSRAYSIHETEDFSINSMEQIILPGHTKCPD